MEQQFDRLNEHNQLKSYITHYGKDPEGKQILPIVEYVGRDEVTEYLRTAKFKSLLLAADLQGKYYITTEFYLIQHASTGFSFDSGNSILTHYTEETEAQQFVESLFPLVERSVLNAVSILLGHNTNRFFAPDGTPQNSEEHQSKPNDRAIVGTPEEPAEDEGAA